MRHGRDGVSREATQRPVFQIITAGQADQTVLDGGPGGHSVFTGRLLEALGEVEDYVTGAELGVLLQRRVRADAFARGSHSQTPAYGRISGIGDFTLVPVTALGSLPATATLPSVATPKPSRTLGWAGVAVGVLGGGALVTAAVAQNRYEDAPLGAREADSLYRTNQVAGWAGYGGVGLSAGLLTTAVLRGEW